MISYNRGLTAVGEGSEQVYVKEYKKRVEEKIMEIIENHHQPKIFDVLQQLKPYIDELSKGSLQEESRYISMLRAALVKNFEFSLFIWQSDQDKNSYFSTATLRGICEDIITLNFISTLTDEDQTKLIETLFKLDLLAASKKQFKFLGKSQPVIRFSDKTNEEKVENLKNDIESIAKKYPRWINLKKNQIGYNKLPTISQMAQFCKLEDLYDYLYAATSRWVHFNPVLSL